MGNISFSIHTDFFKTEFYCSKPSFTVQCIVNIEETCQIQTGCKIKVFNTGKSCLNPYSIKWNLDLIKPDQFCFPTFSGLLKLFET